MGLDLTKVSLPPRGPRTVVKPVDLSRRFAGYMASVMQLPALMAGRSPSARARTLIQFIKDWNYWVDSRPAMLDGPPPPDSDPFDLACIAAIVHALTARDGVDVPEWVHRYRADPPRLFTGLGVDSGYGQLIVAEAPPVCAHHGVYFEAEMLDRGAPTPGE
ncbi:MAG: hypothetical protein OXE75_04650 [bacterium]|nr:hypothetical protein [bacterium]